MTNGKSSKMNRKEKREEQILKAALEIFTRQGYSATTIEKIARVAGVSVGTIYNYYNGKHELFITVLKNLVITAPILDMMNNLPEVDITIILKKIIQNWLKVTEAEPGFRIHHLMSETVRDQELKNLWVEHSIQPFLSLLETLNNAMIYSGKFRKINPAVASRALVGLVIGFNMLLFYEDEKSPLKKLSYEELSEYLADYILHGLSIYSAE